MTSKKFKEALSQIGNSTDWEYDARGTGRKSRTKKRRRAVWTCVSCVLIFAVAAAVTVLAFSLNRPSKQPTQPGYVPYDGSSGIDGSANGMPDSPQLSLSDPPAEQTPAPDETPTETPTEKPTEKPTSVPIEEPAAGLAETADVFPDTDRRITFISYDEQEQQVNLNYGSFGAELIPAEVKGAHANCPGVYYDAGTGKVTCLYHEFLQVSGINVPADCSVEVRPDTVRAGLLVVRICAVNTLHTRDLWLYDRQTKTAARVELPAGCGNYESLDIYENCLWNGRLCISENTDGGRHVLYIYDAAAAEYTRVAMNDKNWVSGQFLSENQLLVNSGGYFVYVPGTGFTYDVIGEYDYCYGGKVYSIRNNGWALHGDVAVAVYDAETGARLDNEPVLVQTVLDDGTRVFLTRNSATGEEQVVLSDYSWGCYAWTPDRAYLYAYSATNGLMVCYSVADGTWITAQVPGISSEPVRIDGKLYTVYPEYSLAVSGDGVVLYYSRTLEEVPVIPDYGDEAVDSPCWDEYCEIKYCNFRDSTHFTFNRGRFIYNGGIIYSVNYNDMECFRNLLLKCLEGKGTPTGNHMTEADHYDMSIYVSCGILRMFFWTRNDTYYMCMDYNKTRGSANDVYEISSELYYSVDSMLVMILGEGRFW